MNRRGFVGMAATTSVAGCLGVLSDEGADATSKLDEAGSKMVQAHDGFYEQRPAFAPESGQVEFDEQRVLDPLNRAEQAIQRADEVATADETRRKIEELRALLAGIQNFATSIPDFETLLNEYLAASGQFRDDEYDAVRRTVEGTRRDAKSLRETFDTARSTIDGVSGDVLTSGEPFANSDEGLLIDSWHTSALVVRDYATSVEEGLTAYEELIGALADLKAARKSVTIGNYEIAARKLDAAGSGLVRANGIADDAANTVTPAMYTAQFDPVVCFTDTGVTVEGQSVRRALIALDDQEYSRAEQLVETAVSKIETTTCRR